MSKIYCFVNSGKGTEWQSVMALAEDGNCLAGHLSSNKYWAMHDIGINSDWKHEHYKEHYPNGYELVWLDDPVSDDGFKLAAKKNEELGKEAELAKDRQPNVTIKCE